MIESLDAGKKVFVNSHGTDSEKSPPNFRYQTIFPGQIDNFGKQLIRRISSFEPINNETMTGKLISFGQYDIVVTDGRIGQNILFHRSNHSVSKNLAISMHTLNVEIVELSWWVCQFSGR